jgi:transposase
MPPAIVLGVAREKKVPRGKAVAVDATTPGADTAMRAVVRKATGEGWKEYLRRLLAEQGAEGPTGEGAAAPTGAA